MPNNSKSLWHAVKIAKNLGESEIPENMLLNDQPVNCGDIAECFAEFFDKKVGDIVNSVVVNPRVYSLAQFVNRHLFPVSR